MPDTLSRMFLHFTAAYPKNDMLMSKAGGAYRPISTADFALAVKEISLGLKSLGLRPGDKLVLLSENRPEWIMVDYAALCAGGVTVPVYTSLTPEQIRYIIQDSEATIVVCSTKEMWSKIEAVREDLPKVAHAVLIEGDPPRGVLALEEIKSRGQALEAAEPGLFGRTAEAVGPDDLASIIYTSGTTGIPKGVMLSHANFVSNIKALDSIVEFVHTDRILSFLPLSHVLERMTTFSFLFKGASIAYAESVETVAENLLEIRPTIMISVPRLFDKIYGKVMDNVLGESPFKRRIFFWALKVGKMYGSKKIRKEPVSLWLRFRRALAGKLVFSKIVEKTGGRVRFFVSGGAPLSKDVAEFFYALGIVILEGYGLTETSPVLSVNTFEAMRFGTVGQAVPGVEIKIAEDGEILARGPNVMRGYYRNEAETQEAFTDGWFRTGDIGFIDSDGFLTITDRKKDLIVTAGGKNVAPQPIENSARTSPYIQNIVVVGGNRKFISALVVPDFERIEAYAEALGLQTESRSDLVGRAEIKDLLLDEIGRANPHLAPYEQVKKIAVLDRDFDQEAGEVTPTLKVKRTIVEEKFRDMIDSFYGQ